MYSFSEMRDYAKKVDEGIEYLEKRAIDPQQLSLVTSQSARIAESTLESINSDLISMKEDIRTHIKEERRITDESKEILHDVEEFMKEIANSIEALEIDLKPFGYIPLSENSSEGCDIASNAAGEDDLKKNKTPFLWDESPVFTSPNYNSTPDSASYGKRDKSQTPFDKQIATPYLKPNSDWDNKKCEDKMLNSSDASYYGIPFSCSSAVKSNNYHKMLRDRTPRPVISIKKKLLSNH